MSARITTHRAFIFIGNVSIEADGDHADDAAFARQRNGDLRLEAVAQEQAGRQIGDLCRMGACVWDNRTAPQQTAFITIRIRAIGSALGLRQ
jgi:hypothetical protein